MSNHLDPKILTERMKTPLHITADQTLANINTLQKSNQQTREGATSSNAQQDYKCLTAIPPPGDPPNENSLMEH